MDEPADLVALNQQMTEIEQAGGEKARVFFEPLLSNQLLFRRATGKTVGKSGPDGFLSGLDKSPFSSRKTEDVSVTALDDRALVTLMIVATRADDGSVHRYRNIRLFTRSGAAWVLELWYNYEVAGV